MTNEDAPRSYRVFKVSLDDPRRSKWKEIIIPQSPTYVLSDASVVGDRLALNGIENVASRDRNSRSGGKIHPSRGATRQSARAARAAILITTSSLWLQQLHPAAGDL